MKCFTLDMDGTIYLGDEPIPGALDFINTLKERKIPFRFLTNNSSNKRDDTVPDSIGWVLMWIHRPY